MQNLTFSDFCDIIFRASRLGKKNPELSHSFRTLLKNLTPLAIPEHSLGINMKIKYLIILFLVSKHGRVRALSSNIKSCVRLTPYLP